MTHIQEWSVTILTKLNSELIPMRLGQTSVIYFFSKILGSALGFFATVYIVRALGEDIYGQYSLVLAVALWAAIGGKIGLTGAVVKRVSEGDERREYITAAMMMGGTLFLIVSIFTIIFRNQINNYIGAPVAEFVILLVFVDLLRGFVNAALKGYHLVHIYAPLSTVKVGVRSLAQIIIVFVGFGLGGILIGYAIGGVLISLIGLWILKFRPSLPTRRHFESLFNYAKFSWLGNLRGRVFNSIDIVVLGVFVSTSLVGIYAVAWSIAKFLNIFGDAVSSTLFPEMSEISAKNSPEAISNLVEDALSFAGLVLIPGLIGGAVIADRLLLIYGDDIVQGSTILVILIAALLVYTYNKQLLTTLNAIDRPDLAFRANFSLVMSNIVFNIILIYQFGWIGAAVATALSATIGLMFASYYTRRHVPFSTPIQEISKQWIAASGMGAVVYGIRRFGEINWRWIADYNAIFVICLVSIGATIYFITLFLISIHFRTTVENNLPVNI